MTSTRPGSPATIHGMIFMPVIVDRKSTRLNSSHSQISYAVFCLKKKKKTIQIPQHHYYDEDQDPVGNEHPDHRLLVLTKRDHSKHLKHCAISDPLRHALGQADS